MKKLLFLTFVLFVAISTHAQSTSSTWIDVTASPYSANNTCSSDAGPAINSAISHAPSGSGSVIFFPVGCYLIQTQIVDTNAGSGPPYTRLTYLGYGAELRASSTSPPTNSIIQFGSNSTTIRYRTIRNLYFNCNGDTIDGVDLDGLTFSQFDDIVINGCTGTSTQRVAAMQTVGTNQSNYSNVVVGGHIFGGSYTGGVLLAENNFTYANNWTFYGTQISNSSSTPSNWIGIDFNGGAGGVYGADIEYWATGIAIGYSNSNFGASGITVSGSYIENNTNGIFLGDAGYNGNIAQGTTITGNYINCSSLTGSFGVRMQQANGFTVSGNRITSCASYAINGSIDGTYQGADNGFVGANEIDAGQIVLLQGSNNTVTNSIATKSANYTLTGTDSWINATGSIIITVPHAFTGHQWKVFNSGSSSVTLTCDSGTINGAASLFISSATGKTVTTDGANCFAQ